MNAKFQKEAIDSKLNSTIANETQNLVGLTKGSKTQTVDEFLERN